MTLTACWWFSYMDGNLLAHSVPCFSSYSLLQWPWNSAAILKIAYPLMLFDELTKMKSEAENGKKIKEVIIISPATAVDPMF